MADFALLGEAIGRRLGWREGVFISAYRENRQAATFASLVMTQMTQMTQGC